MNDLANYQFKILSRNNNQNPSDGWIGENGWYPTNILLVYLLYYLDFLQQDNCAGSPFVWEDRERDKQRVENHQSDAMMLDDGPLDKFLLESKKKKKKNGGSFMDDGDWKYYEIRIKKKKGIKWAI